MKTIGYILGMLLFVLGMSSLMLSITGVNYSFLSFLNALDGTVALLVRLGMVIGGILLLLISSTNWQRERTDTLDAPRWDDPAARR